MDILDKNLSKQKCESPKEYQIRLCKNRKDYDLTWDEVAQILNEEFDVQKSESVYRKWWYAFSEGCEYTNGMYSEIPKGTTYEDIENVKEVNSNEPKRVELEVNNNNEQISTIRVRLSDEQRKDPNYLLKVHGYDPNEWELINAKQSIWNQNSNAKGMIDLYSSKVTVRPKIGFDWNKENVNKLFEGLGKDKIFEDIVHTNIAEDLLLIPLADIHFGLLATRELAGEDYNVTIAKRRVKYVINDILERIENRNISKIIFLIGNDGLNADNIAGTTTKGTPQDNQLNWFETVRQYTDLMIQVIEELEKVAPVMAYFCPRKS